MAEIWTNILSGFKEIFSAPLKDLSIWWLLAPIILFWIILEIYFGRYKTEKLGWNSTLGHGLNMFWIVVIGLRTLFANNFELFTLDKILFLSFIAIYSIFIISVSFTHKLKEKIFFLFASPTLVYYLSGMAVLWFNNLLKIHLWVIIDLIMLYIIILIFETILKIIIPSAPKSGLEDTEMEPGFDTSMGPSLGNTGMGNIGKGLGRF